MELYLPFRSSKSATPPNKPITHIRSTMIVSGIQALRSRGLHEQYLRALEPSVRQQFTALIPGEWLPIEVGLQHYRAAESLRLETKTIDDIGSDVAKRINGTALSVAIKVSRRAGITPWSAFLLSHSIGDRNWRGGDVAVWKLGAKEALYLWVGQPCASVPYFVTAYAGYLRALTALFAEKAHARPVTEQCNGSTIACRITWV